MLMFDRTSCIHNISRSCPLCRTHFDQDSWIKLHVDVEPRLDCSPDDVNEAERLHAAIVKLAEAGTDEASAKQQIHDTKQFLGRHAKDLVSIRLACLHIHFTKQTSASVP